MRALTEQEKQALAHLARAGSERADVVTRARQVLLVASGRSYGQAAVATERCSYQAVSKLVSRFNRDGLTALESHGNGAPPSRYAAAARERILAETRDTPNPEQDGTASWSLMTLRHVLRQVQDGLPHVSTWTIGQALHEAGFRWSGCKTKPGRINPALTRDKAGPSKDKPGSNRMSKYATARPSCSRCFAHAAAKCAPNAVLSPWLRQELTCILERLPQAAVSREATARRAQWESGQQGLTKRMTLPAALPPLRLLLVWDNLQGQLTAALAWWLFANGVMPLHTPLSGSWLNMAESMQRILSRRALADWKRRPRAGIERPRRSSGAASATRVGYAAGNGGTPWADRVLAPGCRCAAEHLLFNTFYVGQVAK